MEIFCDCSFDSKNKIAGIGLLIKDGVKQKTISNWIKAPDNNFGEIWAVYQAAILMGGRDGIIYTDSQTALAYVQDRVKDKPRTREQYENHQRMRLMGYKIRKLKANVEWTKGHVGNFKQKSVDNALADCLAKQGRSKFYR
jgi:ribonuclease HI